jgi:hypothetical protein
MVTYDKVFKKEQAVVVFADINLSTGVLKTPVKSLQIPAVSSQSRNPN